MRVDMNATLPLDWLTEDSPVPVVTGAAGNVSLDGRGRCDDSQAAGDNRLMSVDTSCLQLLVQSRLEQLKVDTCPTLSELASFVDRYIWLTAAQQLGTYLLVGNRWRKPKRR